MATYVYYGDVLSNPDVFSTLYVLYGGSAVAATVHNQGNMYISSGGTAKNTKVYWYLYNRYGGSAISTKVCYNGDFYNSGYASAVEGGNSAGCKIILSG